MASLSSSDIDRLFDQFGQEYNVNPDLIRAQGMQESGLNPDIHDGAAGEIGMMQIKPDTARMLGIDPRDPVDNIRGAFKYMAQNIAQGEAMRNQGGDVPDLAAHALMAYNTGPGAAAAGRGNPKYVSDVAGQYSRIMGNNQLAKAPSPNAPSSSASSDSTPPPNAPATPAPAGPSLPDYSGVNVVGPPPNPNEMLPSLSSQYEFGRPTPPPQAGRVGAGGLVPPVPADYGVPGPGQSPMNVVQRSQPEPVAAPPGYRPPSALAGATPATTSGYGGGRGPAQPPSSAGGDEGLDVDAIVGALGKGSFPLARGQQPAAGGPQQPQQAIAPSSPAGTAAGGGQPGGAMRPITPEEAIRNAMGEFNGFSKPAALGITPDLRPVDINAISQDLANKKQFGIDDPREQEILDAFHQGWGTFISDKDPYKQPVRRINPGGPLDPARPAYEDALKEAVKGGTDIVHAIVTDPQTNRQVETPMPRNVFIRLGPWARLLPEGGAAGPGAAPGPTPGPAAGVPPPATGAPPPAAGAPPPAAGAPPGPNEPTVTRSPRGGPAVIGVPPPAPAPSGIVAPPYLPAGGAEGITGQINSDRKTLDQINADATNAQKQLPLIASIDSALQDVYTGKTAGTREAIGNYLRVIGVPDPTIKNWVGTDPSSHAYLDKALMQLITQQMGGVPQGGLGVMQQIEGAFPSIERTPGPAIKLLINSMRMAAQRAIDMRGQANDFQNDSLNRYNASGGRERYMPLTTFASRFDQENPATDYYHAAQTMTPEFTDEADKAFADAPDGSPERDHILGLVPNGAPFRIEGHNKIMRR